MNLKEQYYFVAQCLTLDQFPEIRDKVISAFSNGEVLYENFISICDKNLILPVIYLKFKRHDLLYLFPEDLILQLQNIYELNKNRNTAILKQVDEINLKLDQVGIEPVYLKGVAHILDGLYTDIGERMLIDIDLLVKEEHYFNTVHFIKELNYKEHKEDPGNALPHTKHYTPLFRNNDFATVEIHRYPVDFNYSKNFSTENMFKRKLKINGNLNFFIPCDEDKIVHNFIHSQLSDLGYILKSTSIRDMYDMYLLSLRRTSKSQVKIKQYKKRFCAYTYYVSEVFNTRSIFERTPDLRTVIHRKLSDFFLNHPKTNNRYIHIIYFFRRYFMYYPSRYYKVIFSKAYRKYLFERKLANT